MGMAAVRGGAIPARERRGLITAMVVMMLRMVVRILLCAMVVVMVRMQRLMEYRSADPDGQCRPTECEPDSLCRLLPHEAPLMRDDYQVYRVTAPESRIFFRGLGDWSDLIFLFVRNEVRHVYQVYRVPPRKQPQGSNPARPHSACLTHRSVIPYAYAPKTP